MADLTIVLPDGNIAEVKISKLAPEGVKKPAIVTRTEDGKLVLKKRKTNTGLVFDSFNYIEVDGEGNVLPKGTKFVDYEVLENGEEVLVSPPNKTKVVKFDKTLPLTYINRLLQSSLYEVYAEDVETQLLLGHALEKAIDTDIAYYHENFTWKGDSYTQYHAIFTPNRLPDGRYNWLLMTTQGKTKFAHLMSPQKAPVVEAKKIESLATIASLIEGN